MDFFLRYSPNHNARPAEPVSLLVLHYTGMPSGTQALEWLCNPASQVSAHYLIEEDGQVFQLVEEDRRAWHAGVSHWAGRDNVNDVSIGIELVNPGHEHGYRPFPAAQMDALVALARDIMRRHEIPPAGVVAHSDIAPARKQDPGELFPWQWCATHGIGLWHGLPACTVTPMSCELLRNDLEGLRGLGYGLETALEHDIITAFQRRFRPEAITGLWDEDCRAKLRALLDKHDI